MRRRAARRTPRGAGIVGLVLGVVTASLAAASGGADVDPLGPLRWERRVLLVFAPHAADPRLASFEAALAARGCAVAERDLVVGRIGPGGGGLGEERLSRAEVGALRERFHIADGEAVVVLVGKDGGEKARSARPDLEALFAQIDGMPMRRSEMRERGSRCGD